MADTTFYLKPLPVKEAVEKWLEVALQAFTGQHILADFLTNFNPIQISIQDWGERLQQNDKVRKLIESLADESLPIECARFSLQVLHSHISIQYSKNSDEIAACVKIINTERFETPDIALNLFRILNKVFIFAARSELLINHLPIAQQEIVKSQYAAIEHLQAETSKIAQSNLNQSNAQSEFLRKSTVEVEERARQREEELAQKRKLAEEELAQKRKLNEEELAAQKKVFEEQSKEKIADIEKREEELKRKIAESDARDNMVVRRQLLTDITGHITKQLEFKLSSSIDEKRKSVRSTFRYSMLVSGIWVLAVVVWFVITLVRGGEPKWYQYAPLSVGILHLVSTAMYYLKWTDSWAREHAQAEMSNKKLNADILRASWLAELFFEGKDKERLLPDMLLSRFSEGLFTDSTSSAPEHPSDQLVNLMKKLSSVKVSKEGVELTKSAAAEEKK